MTSPDSDPVIPAREVRLAEDNLVTATVVRVDYCDEPGLFCRTVGLDATLQVLFPGDNAPDTLFLSRLGGEPCWLQDAHFGPSGLPHFVHGFGSRIVRKRGIPPRLEALLDEAARLRGLAEQIGPDIPLTLPTHLGRRT